MCSCYLRGCCLPFRGCKKDETKPMFWRCPPISRHARAHAPCQESMIRGSVEEPWLTEGDLDHGALRNAIVLCRLQHDVRFWGRVGWAGVAPRGWSGEHLSRRSVPGGVLECPFIFLCLFACLHALLLVCVPACLPAWLLVACLAMFC